MDHLDDEILALAGDSPVRSRRRYDGKRSRDVSSDEESDFSDTSEADAKLVEEVESYGPDLIKDEEDRRYLDNLPEIEREAIIAERAEKKQILKERLEVKRKLKQGKMNKTSSSRHLTRHDKLSEKERKSESLSDLRKKREKKRSKLANENEEEKRDRIFSSESEDNYDSKESQQEVITLEELNSVRISRDELEKWVYTQFFNKTVIGGYARLGIGFDSNKNYIYRITKILDVVEYHRTYKINKTPIKKALILEHGKAKKKIWYGYYIKWSIYRARI
jgi:hypothetical protein